MRVCMCGDLGVTLTQCPVYNKDTVVDQERQRAQIETHVEDVLKITP